MNAKRNFDIFYEYLSKTIYGTYFNEYSKNEAYKIIDDLMIENVEPKFMFEIPLDEKRGGFDILLKYKSNQKNNILLSHNISQENKKIIEWYKNSHNTNDTAMYLGYDIIAKRNNANFYFINNKILDKNFFNELINIYGLNNISDMIDHQLKKCLPILKPWYICYHKSREVKTIRFAYSFFNIGANTTEIINCLKHIGYKYFTDDMIKHLNRILTIDTLIEFHVDMDKNGIIGDTFSVCVFLDPKTNIILIKLKEIFNDYNIFKDLSSDAFNKLEHFKKFFHNDDDINLKCKTYSIFPHDIKIRFKKGVLHSFKIYVDTFMLANSV